MTRDELRTILTRLLAESLDLDDPATIDEHTLFTDLGLTSVALVDLVMVAEQKTGIQLTTEDLTDAATVGDLLDAFERVSQT